jgi:hypothetical protein
MMVPMDGKNFFAADVMRSAFTNQLGNSNANNPAAADTQDDSDGAAPVATATARQKKPARRP